MITMTMFDGGNIKLLKKIEDSEVRLKIRKDRHAKFLQWFYFRMNDVKDVEMIYIIRNAAKASFPRGWPDYRVCASYDRRKWFRLETEYAQKTLKWKFRSASDAVYFAYYVPYGYERQLDLIAKVQNDPRVSQTQVCNSVNGRPLDLLQIGNPDGKKLWFIARQHPGESMASWFMEGLLENLLASDQERLLLKKANIYLIPNMNPDGTVDGNIRVNAAGKDLNREWKSPKRKKSPEVFWTRKRMHQEGVNFFMDIHGDESIPYNFVACSEGVPSHSKKQAELEKQLKADWEAINPDFQSVYGYKVDAPGKANLKIASNYVGEKFGCLSVTLEMPFRDNALRKRRYDNPIPSIKKLASTCLDVLEKMVDEL